MEVLTNLKTPEGWPFIIHPLAVTTPTHPTMKQVLSVQMPYITLISYS